MNINEDGCQPYGRFGLDGDWCIKCDTPTVSTGVGIWCTYPLLGIPTLPPKRTWEQRYLPPRPPRKDMGPEIPYPLPWTDTHLWKRHLPATSLAGGKYLQCVLGCRLTFRTISGSCTAELDFELPSWVQAKATSDCLVRGGWPGFSLFVYICKLVEGKKPPLIRGSEVAYTEATFHRLVRGGPELKLSWELKLYLG